VCKARNESEKEKRRLYKIFGARTSSTDEARDAMVKSYQTEISKRRYPNHGELRDYQVEGVSWLVANYINNRSSILADEMVRIPLNPSFFEEATKY
jgi:SNF2 family DNA or RNA helicase